MLKNQLYLTDNKYHIYYKDRMKSNVCERERERESEREPVRIYRSFLHYLINGTIVEKKSY